MVRRLHGTEITLREDTHGEKTHTERGHTRKGHMEGWNIHGKGNTRNRDYTEKGEGTHAEWEHTHLGGCKNPFGIQANARCLRFCVEAISTLIRLHTG